MITGINGRKHLAKYYGAGIDKVGELMKGRYGFANPLYFIVLKSGCLTE
jgi:hypothetical protein